MKGYQFLGEKKDFKDEHSLIKLWNTYSYEILPKIEQVEVVILNNVGRIISQFNTEDPNSMCFRYPVTRGPIRNESLSRETIDLNNFITVIEKVSEFLDWQWDMLDHYQNTQNDMRTDVY